MNVLLDSDILFSLYNPLDINHIKAGKVFKKLLSEQATFWTANLVLQETVTVISNRLNQKDAVNFLKRFWQINIKVFFINEKLTEKAWGLFKKQLKNKTSFVDCANVVVYKELSLDTLFSFDKFYQKLGLTIQK